MRGFQKLDILHVVNQVLPDLLVGPSSGAPPVLMIEVQSEDFTQTIRRFYLELYICLISLGSRTSHVMKASKTDLCFMSIYLKRAYHST